MTRWTLQRDQKLSRCTLGQLISGSGSTLAHTLEDIVREQQAVPVSAWKVPGETAIPAGTYRVVVTMSNRFKRELPLLLNVPGFEGIRIHPGNTHVDTEGCILVGLSRGLSSVNSSVKCFDLLFPRIKLALRLGELWIDVKNPVDIPSPALQA